MSLLIYPIGKPELDPFPNEIQRATHIQHISSLPSRLAETVSSLSQTQLDTPIRPDAWTICQLVHHITDSHLNAFIRFRWGLTEENPTIKGYNEMDWAHSLPDAQKGAIDLSLPLLNALHIRWVAMLENIQPDQWDRAIINPESGSWTLWKLLMYYSWHGDHHLAQIKQRLDLG